MNIADRLSADYPHEIKPMPKVNLDNVAAFMFPEMFNTRLDRDRDFPNVAPPWEDVLFFWDFGSDTGSYAHTEAAVVASSVRINLGDTVHEMDESEAEGWATRYFFFWTDAGRDDYTFSPIHATVICDDEGNYLGHDFGAVSDEIELGDDYVEWLERECELLLGVALVATSFVHCKNVNATRVEPKLKLAAKQLKKRGIPKVTYHVLTIDSIKSTLRSEGGMAKGEPLSKALHICRGHFKDYRDGAGLFGKYKGMYWWEQTIRGDKESGLALKDYKIGRE